MRVRQARRLEDLPRTLRDQVEVLGEQFFAPFGASGSIVDPARRKVGAEHERLVMLALSMEGITLNDKLLIFAAFEARGWKRISNYENKSECLYVAYWPDDTDDVTCTAILTSLQKL